MKVLLNAYNRGSASAKALSNELKIKQVSANRHEDCDVLINWGDSADKWILNVDVGKEIINYGMCIQDVSNKLAFFQNANCEHVETLNSIPCAYSPEAACEFFQKEKDIVVARHVLNGHSGQGVELFKDKDSLMQGRHAALYTKYIPKKNEYRLHVFGNDVIHVQRKARKKDVPDDQVNWQIRNHANGFIFAQENVDVPDDVKEDAITWLHHYGLHFGALDIIHSTDGGWYLLEINTAPGIEGTTLTKYVNAFKEYLNAL